MPNLPEIQTRVVTSTPGQSPITPSAIAGPYTMLAKALDTTSGALESLSVKAAAEAGPRAVTQDAEGNLQVQQLPMLSGRAGEVFNRSAKLTYLTRLEQKVQADVLAKRLEYDAQPDKFEDWARGYGDQMIGQADDAMRPAVSKMVNGHLEENYRGLAIQRQHLDTQSALTGIKAQIITLDNRAAALARDGGTDTPEYQQAISDSRALYNELGKNPQFNYPQARVDQEIGDMESRHQAEAIIGQGLRIREKYGLAAAKDFYRTSLWDPKLNLSEMQRSRYTSMGLSALDAKTAEQTAQRAELGKEVTQHIGVLQKGVSYDPIYHNDLVAKATQLGDLKQLYELNSWAAAWPIIRAGRGATDSEKVDIFRSLAAGRAGTVGGFNDWISAKLKRGNIASAGPLSDQGADVRTKIAAEAQRQGIDPKLAQTIAYMESGFDPTKKPIGPDGKPLSQAFGLFNFIPTTAARYGVTEASPVEDQIKAGVTELREIRDTLKAQLGRDPTPAEIYTAHYQGLGAAKTIFNADPGADLKSTLDSARPGWLSKSGKTWGEVVLEANPWLGKVTSGDQTPAQQQTTAAVMGKVVTSFRGDLKTRANASVDDLISGIKKRENFTPEELFDLANMINLSGAVEVGAKLASYFESAAGADQIRYLPQDKREAFIASLRAKASSDGLPKVERKMLEIMQANNEQAKQAMKDDPLTEIGVRGWAPAPKAIDWSNPQSAGAEFASREHGIQTARARDNTLGPISVLTAAEQGALKSVLTQGDPAQGAAMLAAIRANTSPDTWRATMFSPGMKDALDASARSYEPTRLNTAMTTLDQLYRADRLSFHEVYKDETLARLQTWQAYKDSMSPQQMAEKFQQVDDPNTRDARAKLVKEAGTKLGPVTPTEVAAQMGVAWIPGFVARPLGLEAAAPGDVLQGQRMVEDYKHIVEQRYADTGDIGTAKQQAAQTLALRWGASTEVGNNTLMLYPPERYYPQVNGSHDWMKRQIVSDVVKYIGEKRGQPIGDEGPISTDFGFDVGTFVHNLNDEPVLPTGYSYRIIPDAQTEAEIKGGKPPSYRVVVTDDKGITDIMRGPDNRELRYRWDAGPAQGEAEAQFNQARPFVLAIPVGTATP